MPLGRILFVVPISIVNFVGNNTTIIDLFVSFFTRILQVSWIRKRDLHILTFGQVTYTNDARFSVIKSASGDMWTLRIRSVQLRDAGLYECQVSSEPKISKAVRLKVVGESHQRCIALAYV